jgi:hypothetical protein
MTFCPEWIDGNPNLDGSTFTLLWVSIMRIDLKLLLSDLFGLYEWPVGGITRLAVVGKLS